MANFGQMLAAAQAYATPEQQRKVAQTQAMGAEREVAKEKKSQMEELQALMEAEMAKAAKEEGGLGFLGDIGKLVGFLNPTIGAGLSALGGASQAKGQKEAVEALMNDPKFAKYKGTWLSDPTKKFQEQAKELSEEIDPLKTGIASFGTSLAAGKAAKGMGSKLKGMFKPGTTLADTALSNMNMPGGGTGGISVTDIVGGLKGGGGGPFENLMGNIGAGGGVFKGGLKNLFQNFDLMDVLGQSGKVGMDTAALNSLMKLISPGGGVSFSTSDLFNND